MWRPFDGGVRRPFLLRSIFPLLVLMGWPPAVSPLSYTSNSGRDGAEQSGQVRMYGRNPRPPGGAGTTPERRLFNGRLQHIPPRHRPQPVGLCVVDELLPGRVEAEAAAEQPGERGGVAGDVGAAHDTPPR